MTSHVTVSNIIDAIGGSVTCSGKMAVIGVL
jgi:hypothetical protein